MMNTTHKTTPAEAYFRRKISDRQTEIQRLDRRIRDLNANVAAGATHQSLFATLERLERQQKLLRAECLKYLYRINGNV
jgi:hypothetical protein